MHVMIFETLPRQRNLGTRPALLYLVAPLTHVAAIRSLSYNSGACFASSRLFAVIRDPDHLRATARARCAILARCFPRFLRKQDPPGPRDELLLVPRAIATRRPARR